MQSRQEEVIVSIWGRSGVSLPGTPTEGDIKMGKESSGFHQFAVNLKAYMVPDSPSADRFLLKVTLALQSWGLPWQPSGEDSTLPLQGARVRSLVRELRSLVLRGTANKKKKKNCSL